MINLAAIFALGQATVTALLALSGYHEEGVRFGLVNLLDVLLLGGFGLAIFRGFGWATCFLAAYGLLDFVGKYQALGKTPWVIPALVYCAGACAFISAAWQRRREHVGSASDYSNRKKWPAWLAACAALIQVYFALAVVLAAADERGATGVNFYSLLDIVVLCSFSVAVLKQHLWAAYGLIGYGVMDYFVKVAYRGESPLAAYFLI